MLVAAIRRCPRLSRWIRLFLQFSRGTILTGPPSFGYNVSFVVCSQDTSTWRSALILEPPCYRTCLIQVARWLYQLTPALSDSPMNEERIFTILEIRRFACWM